MHTVHMHALTHTYIQMFKTLSLSLSLSLSCWGRPRMSIFQQRNRNQNSLHIIVLYVLRPKRWKYTTQICHMSITFKLSVLFASELTEKKYLQLELTSVCKRLLLYTVLFCLDRGCIMFAKWLVLYIDSTESWYIYHTWEDVRNFFLLMTWIWLSWGDPVWLTGH